MRALALLLGTRAVMVARVLQEQVSPERAALAGLVERFLIPEAAGPQALDRLHLTWAVAAAAARVLGVMAGMLPVNQGRLAGRWAAAAAGMAGSPGAAPRAFVPGTQETHPVALTLGQLAVAVVVQAALSPTTMAAVEAAVAAKGGQSTATQATQATQAPQPLTQRIQVYRSIQGATQ